MNKNLRNRILTILLVLIVGIYYAVPVEKLFNKALNKMGWQPLKVKERINLGLDLKGGMHLIIKVDTEKLDANAKSDAVLRAIEILRNRIDSLGAGESPAFISIFGDNASANFKAAQGANY